MKTTKLLLSLMMMLAIMGMHEAFGQWATIGTNIYNTNTGNVGIGNSSPSTLLYVAKNMTEPTITVRNLGGIGGATFAMVDNASGANWKFKATNSGGFKIRDHSNLMDVIVIEPNSRANMLYISSSDNFGIGTSTPIAKLDVRGTNTDDGVVVQLGNSDLSHRLVLFGGRLNDPNPFIQWKEGDPLRFSTDEGGWSEKMRITDDGKVGIGTSNPVSELEVAGTIHSTSGGFKFPDGTVQTSTGSIPPGVIVMWSGLLVNIPTGWALCDGTNGTPDLRNRFIHGTATGENPGATGGNATHSHTVDPPNTSTSGPIGTSIVLNVPPSWVVPSNDHYHTVDIPAFVSGNGSSLPPYYKLAFIMKL